MNVLTIQGALNTLQRLFPPMLMLKASQIPSQGQPGWSEDERDLKRCTRPARRRSLERRAIAQNQTIFDQSHKLCGGFGAAAMQLDDNDYDSDLAYLWALVGKVSNYLMIYLIN